MSEQQQTTHQSNKMTAKLTAHYGLPDKDPRRAIAVVSEYVRLTKDYSDNELSEGADVVLRRHRFKTWPTIAECINALEDYRARVRDETAPERKRDNFEVNYPEWSEKRIADADSLIKSDLGRKAAEGGWILGLHDFCRNHGRLPKNHEIPEIMANSRFIDRFMAGEVDRDDVGLPPTVDGEISLKMSKAAHGVLRDLAASMIAKRERLCREVLGQ